MCSFHPVLLWCERTQQSYGTAKECSLNGHQVDGWMLLKLQKPMSEGWNRSWTLVWSLFCVVLLFFFLCFMSEKKLHLCVLSSCTGEKEGLHQKNPANVKTVRYCFVTFFPAISFETPNLSPLLCSTTFSSVKQTSKLLVRHKVLFLHAILTDSELWAWRGEKKQNNKKNNVFEWWQPHASVKPCIHSELLILAFTWFT